MVQVLKDELRQAIIRTAQDEFMTFGYPAASIKRIADKVGMSVGNLYRYYNGKDALFDAVVEPVFHELELILNCRFDQPVLEENRNIIDLIVHALTKVVRELRSPLLILMHGSKGTKHEEALDRLHQLMADKISGHLERYNESRKESIYTLQVTWPISVAFMQGFFEIIRRYPDESEREKMIWQYVSFWYKGLGTFIR